MADQADSSVLVVKPPTPLIAGVHYKHAQRPSVFLAGSIEMGKSIDWQMTLADSLRAAAIPCIVLNPRRDAWDASWKQDISNPVFKEQVTWELDAQDHADLILMYFAPGTQSPISLLELGLFAASKKMVVCCPEGFWRRGNVQVVCERYRVSMVDSLEDLMLCGQQMLQTIAANRAA